MAKGVPAAKKPDDDKRLIELIDRMTDRRSAITKLEEGGYVDDEDLDGGEGLDGPNPKVDLTDAIAARWGHALPRPYAALLRARGRRNGLLGGMSLLGAEELLAAPQPVLARGGGLEAAYDPATGAVSVGEAVFPSIDAWLAEANAAQRRHLARLSVEADPLFTDQDAVRKADAATRAALLDAEVKTRGLA